MNTRLLNLLSFVFSVPVDRIDENTSPENLTEWDSLGTVNLVEALEKEFKYTFSLEEIVRLQSVSAIDQILRNKGLLQ